MSFPSVLSLAGCISYHCHCLSERPLAAKSSCQFCLHANKVSTCSHTNVHTAVLLSAEQLDARHVAIGVGLFNAIGAAVGGFLGPYVTGAVVHRLGSFVQATLIQGSFLAASACLAIGLGLFELQMRRRDRKQALVGPLLPPDVAGQLQQQPQKQ